MRYSSLALSILAVALSGQADAQVVSYTDEATFLSALTQASLPALGEGFEDNATWGAVRTTIVGGVHSAPSINSNGITWTGNTAISEVTTGGGSGHSGQYFFYQTPHGDIANGIPDGWKGFGDTPLAAIGGWVQTNTPLAGISLFLDGTEVSFNGPTVFGNGAFHFFGAIDLAGFQQFEFRETEASAGDWKLIFADDFTFAFGGSLLDCNQNGIGDALDIGSGSSNDCNGNAIPDECEIDAGGSALGGPFFCQANCAEDCNNNGLLDACELVQPAVLSSGLLSPIGAGSPQAFTLSNPPIAMGDVRLDLAAYANLSGQDEFLLVRLNGTSVGRVFEYGGEDCPEGQHTAAHLVIPRATFVSLVGSGPAAFEFVASAEVDADDCDLPSELQVQVTIPVPSALDSNANGVLDSCEGLGTVYCVAGPNSVSATGARISATGSSTVILQNLVLKTSSLPPGQFGLYFFGPNQVQVPFGEGFRCIGGGLWRLPISQASASGEVTLKLDFNLHPATLLMSGTTHNLQFWYRDPTGGPAGFNLSDALQLSFF